MTQRRQKGPKTRGKTQRYRGIKKTEPWGIAPVPINQEDRERVEKALRVLDSFKSLKIPTEAVDRLEGALFRYITQKKRQGAAGPPRGRDLEALLVDLHGVAEQLRLAVDRLSAPEMLEQLHFDEADLLLGQRLHQAMHPDSPADKPADGDLSEEERMALLEDDDDSPGPPDPGDLLQVAREIGSIFSEAPIARAFDLRKDIERRHGAGGRVADTARDDLLVMLAEVYRESTGEECSPSYGDFYPMVGQVFEALGATPPGEGTIKAAIATPK